MKYSKVNDEGKEVLGNIEAADLPEMPSLPSGTENQTLRHNGTEWVVSNSMTLQESASELFFEILFSADSGGAFSTYMLDGDYIMSFGDGSNCINITSQALNGTAIMTFSNGVNVFKVSANGQIKSNYLSGTTSSLLEALPDGTIQRSTQTIPQGLPEGTVNQTLRHNGTAWVSTSRITNVENETGSAFTISSPNVSQIASRAGTSSSYINLKHDDNGIHIYSYVSGSEQILRISPSGTAGDRLQLRTTTTYMPDEIMIRHKNFNVYQNGKIQSANLAGTGTARAVIDYNGNIMRDETIAVTPPQPIVFDKQITTPSTMVEITAAELGITSGRLTDLVKSFDPYFYDRSNDTMSTVGIQAKVITPNTVAVDFTQQYPVGTIVRVLLIIR